MIRSEEKQDMTLEQYLIKLVKRWKLIVICIVLLGVAAYIGSRLMTPIYQSTALVQITIHSNVNQSDYNGLLASDLLVQTEATLATSDPVLREVASHYPGLTIENLSKEVTTTAKTNTQLFEIDVQDPSPTRAAAIANDIAATLIKQQIQLSQQGDMQAQQNMQQDLQQTQQQIDAISAQIATLQAGRGSTAQINNLKAQLNSLQQHYSLVQAAQAQLELTQAQNDNFLRITQPAQPALKPVQPNKLLNTGIGLLTGLLLGILLALLFEQLDTHVRTPEALTQLLGLPVLAAIFQAEPKEDVINPTGRNANVEPYRILRTNIGFSAIDKPLRTLVVTSASPRDGKSVIAANLAIFMARAGKNTLLIDADLRRPRQHDQFGLPSQTMGFSNAILAFSMPFYAHASAYQQPPLPSLDPFIHAADIPNLCVMPSGPLPPNPPELLDSKALQQLLTALASSGAEVVIFDAPPLLGLSDASILASKTDGTLVVVDITRANKGHLQQLKAILEQAGANALGCVVNRQRRSRDNAIYSYYYAVQEQTGGNSQSRKNGHNTALVTPDIMKMPKTQPQQDLLDNTIRIESVPPMEVDTQSQSDVSEKNTVKTASVYLQPETESLTERLDGRKSGKLESGE
jgi:capsular exopolysaccharide synthesis family protein